MRRSLNPIARLRESNLFSEFSLIGSVGRLSLWQVAFAPFWGIVHKASVLSWARKQQQFYHDGDNVSGYSQDRSGAVDTLVIFFACTSVSSIIIPVVEFVLFVKYPTLYQSLRGLHYSENKSLLPNTNSLYGRVANVARKQSLFDSIHVGLMVGMISSVVTFMVFAITGGDWTEDDMTMQSLSGSDETWYGFRYDLHSIENEGIIATSVVLSTAFLVACAFQAYIRWQNRSNESTAGYKQLNSEEEATFRI